MEKRSVRQTLTHGWRVAWRCLPWRLCSGCRFLGVCTVDKGDSFRERSGPPSGCGARRFRVSAGQCDRGTAQPDADYSGGGDFFFLTCRPTLTRWRSTHKGFKTLKRTGIAVSPGDRVSASGPSRWKSAHDRNRNGHRGSHALADAELGTVGHDHASRGPEHAVEHRIFTNLTAVIPGSAAAAPARVGDRPPTRAATRTS